MKHLTRMVCIACGLMTPFPLVAQLLTSPGHLNPTHASAMGRLRPSMLTRYATTTRPHTDVVAVRGQLEWLAKRLLPSAARFLGTITQAYPLALNAAGMVRNDR